MGLISSIHFELLATRSQVFRWAPRQSQKSLYFQGEERAPSQQHLTHEPCTEAKAAYEGETCGTLRCRVSGKGSWSCPHCTFHTGLFLGLTTFSCFFLPYSWALAKQKLVGRLDKHPHPHPTACALMMKCTFPEGLPLGHRNHPRMTG